jgi:sugar phosphate permease
VPAACRDECRRLGQVTVIGFFRLFERIGSALGPLIAGALLEPLGYVATMVAMGIGMAIASLLLGLVWNSSERQPKGSVPALPGE